MPITRSSLNRIMCYRHRAVRLGGGAVRQVGGLRRYVGSPLALRLVFYHSAARCCGRLGYAAWAPPRFTWLRLLSRRPVARLPRETGEQRRDTVTACGASCDSRCFSASTRTPCAFASAVRKAMNSAQSSAIAPPRRSTFRSPSAIRRWMRSRLRPSRQAQRVGSARYSSRYACTTSGVSVSRLNSASMRAARR